MKTTFYSNGKLLITGEYLVLDGARAFALPTKFGQNLIVENGSGYQIQWKSYNIDEEIWFEDTVTFDEIINNPSVTNESVKTTLINILHEAYLLNPAFINNSEGYTVITKLTFPKNWGLGTSSTLLNNIAQWTQIDAFTLLKNSFGGSGYDIACAQNNFPVLFHLENEKPIVEPVKFAPSFTGNLYFVYLNQKQSSKNAIAFYKEKRNNLETQKEAINQITKEVLKAENEDHFRHALEKHENILSRILETKTVKECLFPDFNGTVKSLGAWGGDFVLAVSRENPNSYFAKKGYPIVVPYKEMIL